MLASGVNNETGEFLAIRVDEQGRVRIAQEDIDTIVSTVVRLLAKLYLDPPAENLEK